MATGNTKFKNGIHISPQSADPSSPAEGDQFYSDGTSRAKGMWQYKDGAWAEFGGGSAAINHLEGDSSDAENGIGDWLEYNDAAGVNPADGADQATTQLVTFTQNETTPLRGSADFKYTAPASNAQGHGASCLFTIDRADKAQMQTICFDYDCSDPNYEDDFIRISVYDVTNSNLIRINGEDLKAGKGKHYAQFQTAGDSVSYKLIFHQSTDDTAGFSVYFKNILVGPSIVQRGAEVGEVGEILTMAENVVLEGPYLYANGDPISRTTYADLYNAIGTTYGVGDGSTTFNLPDYRDQFFRGDSGSRAVGTTQAGTTSASGLGGTATSAGSHVHNVLTSTSGSASAVVPTTSNALTGGNGAQWQANFIGSDGAHTHPLSITGAAETRPANIGVRYYIRYRTDRVISADLGGREIVVEGAGNGGTAITANVTNIDFTETRDTTASWNGTQFTSPETGDYDLEGSVFATTTHNGGVQAYIDTVADKFVGVSQGTNSATIISSTIHLIKGQVLSFRLNTSVTLSNSAAVHHIHISKKASPQTILETETVAARYTSNSGQSIPNAVDTLVVYEDLDYDTHDACDGAGTYTIPVSGKYSILGRVQFGVATGISLAAIFIDGSVASRGNVFNASSNENGSLVEDTMDLVKDQTVKIYIYQTSGGADTVSTDTTRNIFTIARIK